MNTQSTSVSRQCKRLSALVFCALTASTSNARAAEYRFDFGPANVTVPTALAPQYLSVGAQTRFSSALGYGWLETTGLAERDRKSLDATRRDLVFSNAPHTFRIAGLKPGLYRLTVVCGDALTGSRSTRVRAGDDTAKWPNLQPTTGVFNTLTGVVKVVEDTLDIQFDSPETPARNWVVNALTLQETTTFEEPKVTAQKLAQPSPWLHALDGEDPTKPLLANFRQTTDFKSDFVPDKLSRADYLKLVTSEVDFWKTQQDANGAIIDPYRKKEVQYSTPCYALAAATAVVDGNRKDLLESAAKAMDWSTLTFSQRRAATGTEDFFAPVMAHALPILKPLVAPERAARWESEIRSTDPYTLYRQPIGANNWNMVAASGEWLFQQEGWRPASSKYVSESVIAQGRHFGTPYGLYLEGPWAYDAFPRLWASDLISHRYAGADSPELSEMLRRGAITSLFLQSPWGELPAGYRSAQHQWNEAEQCVIFEIYAAHALKNGDAQLAGMYKRAAHLALSSMQRWVRPSGEMQIIKNWIDPAQRHAFEGYSEHSNYNLLPAAMLAIAYQQAQPTESVAEVAAPADKGGFVLQIEPLHTVIANAAGTYIQINTNADHHYDATGLMRIHMPSISPQLGPSDGIVPMPRFSIAETGRAKTVTAVGIAWKDDAGQWHHLGELDKTTIEKWSVANIEQAPKRVAFDVIYEGQLFGVRRITEHYLLTPGRVELRTKLDGYTGPLRYVWPVLSDDGRTKSMIALKNGTVSVSQDGGKTAQTFTPQGAAGVQIGTEKYGNHNGWVQLATAEYPQGGTPTLRIGG